MSEFAQADMVSDLIGDSPSAQASMTPDEGFDSATEDGNVDESQASENVDVAVEPESDPVESNEPASVEVLTKQIAQLQAEMLKMVEERNGTTDAEESDEEQRMTSAEWEAKKKEDIASGISFITDDQYAEAISSPEGMNKILSVTVNAAVQAALRAAHPVMVQVAESATQRAEFVKDFFNVNPDLKTVQPMVRAVANEILREKGDDIDPETFAKEVASKTRARLALAPKQSQTKRNPGFMQPRASRSGSSEVAAKGRNDKAQIAELLG